jgi:DNA-binding MarR family transcriptional regulator
MNRAETISELMSLVASIKRSLQGRSYPCPDGSSLTSGQLGLLFALKHHGPTSAQELASRLSLTPGAISQLVETLAERGYVTRTPRTDDRRTIDLSLSKNGASQVTALERKRLAIIEQSTAELSDAELMLLVTAHQKILQALQNELKSTERKR